MPDIESRNDLDFLISTFYSTLLKNKEMKKFFEHIDFEAHRPRMISFWDFIVFNTPNAYTGSLMPVHEHLHKMFPFEKQHFEIWLATFKKTVDENFVGDRAEAIKNAAVQIGATMKYKIIGSDSKHSFNVTKIE